MRSRRTAAGKLALPLLALAALVAMASAATAAHTTASAGLLHGMVHDSVGTPIPEADVAIVAQHLVVRTDAKGIFVLRRVHGDRVEISIRRLGYQPIAMDIDLDAHEDADNVVDVMMRVNPLELPGMVSQQTMRRLLWIQDFYRRRAQGIGGTYFTRDDIEARHPSRLTDVLRDAPGVRFSRTRDGSALRFDAASNFRQSCVPQIFLDGQRVSNADVDQFSPRDIEGVELYQGPSSTPMQFQQGAITSCGTIVIWTRVPGT